MGSPSCVLSIPMIQVAVLSFCFGVATSSSSSLQLPPCHDDESSALLQFKQSFIILSNDSKLSSWQPPPQACCSWDGVECDEKTGHVIGLDLYLSYIHGSINSNSTLFRLVHLERLDLSVNDFNSSQIPPTIGNLSKLRYLDLSGSNFSGQAPSEILQLSKLTFLHLTHCNVIWDQRFLRNLAQNLTSLEEVDLSYTTISSTFPGTLANLSHLTTLSLRRCDIFSMLPLSLGNLRHLVSLQLGDNEFTGQIPSSIGNLTQLASLGLYSNHLSGPIPASLGNLTQLSSLRLAHNSLNGSIPQSLFNLMNLQSIDIDGNDLSGRIEFHKFLRLQNLTHLFLSGNNKLEVLMNNATTSVAQFVDLGLGSCNLREFPYFLRFQTRLEKLQLYGNKLQGRVPEWMWNVSTQTLTIMDLSNNSLSDFAQPPAVIPWVNLLSLDISSNMLSSWLLLPSITSIQYYSIANNNLTGQVSPMICNLPSLIYLDLSNNKLTGDLPKCGGDFGVVLEYLILRNNSFHGSLSWLYPGLVMMDVSQNNFHGPLPRSLANCTGLESLVLSYNKLNDTFPLWLRALPELKIMAIDHNKFNGVIGKPIKEILHFPMLRILDLSYNDFSGEFPFEYIFSGNGEIISSSADDSGYYQTYYPGIYYFSFTIMSKGAERYYEKMRDNLILIDISENNFEGKIPEFIGKLKGIWSLNVSNNILTGSIPSSLSNLSRLESLDLSHNKLSGQIPQQLAQLDFLTMFNVSQNNLTGPVPRGIHFTTFDITAYQGNPGLCGDPLPKKCVGAPLPPSTSEEEDDDSGPGIDLDWKFVGAGLGSGLLVGVVSADYVMTKWSVRFLEVVAVLMRVSKRMRKLEFD